MGIVVWLIVSVLGRFRKQSESERESFEKYSKCLNMGYLEKKHTLQVSGTPFFYFGFFELIIKKNSDNFKTMQERMIFFPADYMFSWSRNADKLT